MAKVYDSDKLKSKLNIELRNASIVAQYAFMTDELDWKYDQKLSWLAENYFLSYKRIEQIISEAIDVS
tara:strand:+ start:137 stop:340 length:204 start_codon:yes stop_codon:yes gene_type:complete